MHYPWWHVPYLTSPMLIAAIAVIHMLVVHYAVGGGLFLAVETTFAYRGGDRKYLDYLKKHTRFFVLLTVAFGAITGVGIWWTIGLASPLATQTLINTFVFGWAMEWVFFIVEIVSAFIFYYYWGRLPERIHIAIGWIYGLAAWISLVLITGITSFMLQPGEWLETGNFWTGLFNPQFLPQVLTRTGGALVLTALYVYLHASITLKDETLRAKIARRTIRPAAFGAVMLLCGGFWALAKLPDSAFLALPSAATLNILVALLFGMIGIILVGLYVGPYRNPGWLSPGFAGLLLLVGFGAVGDSEFIREGIRKPYIIYNHVLGNQIFVDQVPIAQRQGYLETGVWTKAWMQQKYPEVIADGRVDPRRLRGLSPEKRIEVGHTIFQYHCNDCHAAKFGYSGTMPLLGSLNVRQIYHLLSHLNESRFFMPPFCGTAEEAEVLAEYLSTIAQIPPEGMRFGPITPDADEKQER
jgi:cytochrome bd-type quinol oxidase subunit 1